MQEVNLPEQLHKIVQENKAHGIRVEWYGPGERYDAAIFSADGVKCWCADYYEYEGLLRDDIMWQDADDTWHMDSNSFYAEFDVRPAPKLTDEEWDMLKLGYVPQYPYQCEIAPSSSECKRIDDVIAFAEEIATFNDDDMVVMVDTATGNVRLRVPIQVWLIDDETNIIREVKPSELSSA